MKDHEREFAEYVAGRQEALRRAAYLLCRDVDRVDDLVQTAITKLFISWRRARSADSIDAYAHTVLVRVFLDEQRRGWWRVRLDERLPERAAPEIDTTTRLTLEQALAALTPRQRAVVMLRFYQDLTVDQAADALGCTAGTVKSQTHRALGVLRAVLGADIAPLVAEGN
jgi:RNA polymerase sigma-70 factor (sigma-E family)